MYLLTVCSLTSGQFELSCLTGDHYQAGMRQHYEVKSCSAKTPAPEHFTSTVQYYIAAEEVEWNYAPDRTWELEKHKTTLKERYTNKLISICMHTLLSQVVKCKDVRGRFGLELTLQLRRVKSHA